MRASSAASVQACLKIAKRLVTTIATLPAHLRRSLTWDQGAEMGAHHLITLQAQLPIYFCDPCLEKDTGAGMNVRDFHNLVLWSPICKPPAHA